MHVDAYHKGEVHIVEVESLAVYRIISYARYATLRPD